MSLLSLPAELLTSIVTHLGASQADFDDFELDYQPDVTLYRLAQTCRNFRDLCTQKLYEIINLQTGTDFGRKRTLFRTLAARPDLAKSVKRVIVDGSFADGNALHYYTEDGAVISAEDATTFNRFLDEKLDMSTVAPFREMHQADLTERDDCDTLGHSLACLGLALTPNITSAIFTTHYVSLGSFKPGSFPLLTAFSLQHADTELAAHFELVRGVLSVAPGVTEFVGWSINDIPGDTPYPSMKKLVLIYSSIEDDEVETLPAAFPNLEFFSYTYGGPMVSDRGSASPRVMGAAVLGLKETLKHVEIDAYEQGDEMWIELEPEDCMMESLSQMQVLKSLRIHALYIYPDEAYAADFTGPKMTLVNFLPPSIETLHVEELQSDQLQDVLDLAGAAPDRFPKLSTVMLPRFDASLQGIVRQAFSKHGIVCIFETVLLNAYSAHCRG